MDQKERTRAGKKGEKQEKKIKDAIEGRFVGSMCRNFHDNREARQTVAFHSTNPSIGR